MVVALRRQFTFPFMSNRSSSHGGFTLVSVSNAFTGTDLLSLHISALYRPHPGCADTGFHDAGLEEAILVKAAHIVLPAGLSCASAGMLDREARHGGLAGVVVGGAFAGADLKAL